MKLFYTCEKGINACLQTERFTISHLMPSEKTMTIHIHNCYEIYYPIAGGKEIFIGNKYYQIHPNDVFWVCPNENHHVTQLDNIRHERINIAIHPKFLERYSTSSTPLADCFHPKCSQDIQVLNLSSDTQKQFQYLVQKISQFSGFGADLLEDLYMCKILIMLQNCRLDENTNQFYKIECSSSTVKAVLQYINEHLTDEISIQLLSKEFFVSPSYICRLFKKYTGITINKYISARRISLAIALINDGVSLSDVFLRVGFNNYNNFYKTFVAIVGTSPKKYINYD